MLEGKVAIVTGSSRGIGLAIAEGFVQNKAKVVICGSSIESATKGMRQLLEKYPQADLYPLALDMTSTDSIRKGFQEVADKYAEVDILVNNAGIAFAKKLSDMTDLEYARVMDINAGGTMRCCREVLPYMPQGGSIINISSMNGIYGSPTQVAYSASKAAVIGITKSLAKELGRCHIRVNALAPGMIGTDMVRESVSEDMKVRLMAMTPIGRMGEPQDLQGICNLLASEAGSFITGTVISIDGGLVL